MTTAAEVVAEARNLFMTSQRDKINVLAADITPTATAITVSYDTGAQSPTAIVPGAELEIDTEAVFVASGGAGSTSLTVIRGWRGSKKTAHTAGSAIRVNPVLWNGDLLANVNHELRDLSSPQNGLFQIDHVDVTPSGDTGYNLPLTLALDAPIIDVLAVRQQEPRGWWQRIYGWEFVRDLNDDFTSGYGLHLKGDFDAGRTLRVWVKAGFSLLTALADDVTEVAGFPDEGVDLLSMGAAIRAANPREIGRNLYDRQSDPRRAQETATGAQLQAPAAMRQMYEKRKSAERARLMVAWKRMAS